MCKLSLTLIHSKQTHIVEIIFGVFVGYIFPFLFVSSSETDVWRGALRWCYNTVYYNTVLHAAPRRLWSNIDAEHIWWRHYVFNLSAPHHDGLVRTVLQQFKGVLWSCGLHQTVSPHGVAIDTWPSIVTRRWERTYNGTSVGKNTFCFKISYFVHSFSFRGFSCR